MEEGKKKKSLFYLLNKHTVFALLMKQEVPGTCCRIVKGHWPAHGAVRKPDQDGTGLALPLLTLLLS